MKNTFITTLKNREMLDPTVNIDTLSNDPQGDIVNEDSTINATARELEEDASYVSKTFIISQVTPMTIMNETSPNGGRVCALVFLCKDRNHDFFFTLVHNYIVENDDQQRTVEQNPIHDMQNFISKKIATNMVLANLPSYITDMHFYMDQDTDIPHEKFFMYAVPNREDRKIVKFTMTPEVFSSMAFIDDYIVSDSQNIHDLQVATIAGYDANKMLVTTHFVDNVDSIVSLAEVEKGSTTLAVVFKIIEFTKDKKESYKILTSFDFGKKYNKKKFRGNTVKNLEDNYATDVDQYLSSYMIECRLKNVDKDYLIIKGKNKDGLCKLFFLDNDIQQNIIDMVDRF